MDAGHPAKPPCGFSLVQNSKGTVLPISPGIDVPDDPETSPGALRSPIPHGRQLPDSRAIRAPVLFGLITGADVKNQSKLCRGRRSPFQDALVFGSSMRGEEFKTQSVSSLTVGTDHYYTSSALRLSAVQIPFQSEVAVSLSISKEVPFLSM